MPGNSLAIMQPLLDRFKHNAVTVGLNISSVIKTFILPTRGYPASVHQRAANRNSAIVSIHNFGSATVITSFLMLRRVSWLHDKRRPSSSVLLASLRWSLGAKPGYRDLRIPRSLVMH